MKTAALLLFLLILPFFSSANESHHHGHHSGNHDGHQELKADAPASNDNSVWQLNSQWTNQKGEKKSLAQLSGSPYLVAMLFTNCETACPLIVEDLKAIYEALPRASKKKIKIAVFSLDPERDTPEALAAFAKKRSLSSAWELYSGNADSIAELAAALGVRYKKLDNGDYIHSNVIYYLNKEGVVTAQKEGLKTPNKKFLKRITEK